MGYMTHVGLAGALKSFQTAPDLNRQQAAVDMVLAALRQHVRMRRCGQHADDVLQSAVVSIMRAATPFRESADGQAFAYLGTVVYRALLDRVGKRARTDPLMHAVSSYDDSERSALDTVAAPELDPARSPDAPLALEGAIDRLRGYLDEAIDEAALTAARRHKAWLQGNASICANIGGQGADAIAQSLGVQASESCVWKWTERGRSRVLEALDRWIQECPEDQILVAELRGRFEKRRKDAGKARLRRRGGSVRSRGKAGAP